MKIGSVMQKQIRNVSTDRTNRQSVARVLTFAILLAIAVMAAPAAHAQTFSVVHTFTGNPDGAEPFQSSPLILNGALYGTSLFGGLSDNGTIFKLDRTGKVTVLYNFTGGTDGGVPDGTMIADTKGNLYGTTNNGGDPDCGGCGVVYRFNKNGLKVLYSFTGGADGAFPQGVVMDTAGNLYGGTYQGGGACDCGVIYKIDTSGHQSVLHTFTGGADGGSPNGFVSVDSAGNVYGAALTGGTSGCCGVVFKIDSGGTETELYNFTGGADGSLPNASFLMDAQGNLYGTTIAGGDLSCSFAGNAGCGVVFKVTPAGKEKVLYTFHGADGATPNYGLIKDAKGNGYSTTTYGGTDGFGTVFELTHKGVEKVLYNFTGGTDGALPYSGLAMDAKGNIYSNTFQGGDLSCNSPNGCGTLFKISR
jgi:uncharacterized repeat protein (TIGR03803 family)